MAKEWSNESGDIFERFAAGIDDAISKGGNLDAADRDLNYGIKLQHDRLEKHGVTMKMDITPRGLWTEGFKLGCFRATIISSSIRRAAPAKRMSPITRTAGAFIEMWTITSFPRR